MSFNLSYLFILYSPQLFDKCVSGIAFTFEDWDPIEISFDNADFRLVLFKAFMLLYAG